MTEREWDASRYDSAHSFVWERGRGVVELLAARAAVNASSTWDAAPVTSPRT